MCTLQAPESFLEFLHSWTLKNESRPELSMGWVNPQWNSSPLMPAAWGSNLVDDSFFCTTTLQYLGPRKKHASRHLMLCLGQVRHNETTNKRIRHSLHFRISIKLHEINIQYIYNWLRLPIPLKPDI
jgi:hypothetical protein